MARAAIIIAAAVLLPVMAAVNMAALSRARKACGERISRLETEKKPALYALLPLSALLIPLCLLRDFGSAGTFAICGCGVLGFYLSFREICFRSRSGICKNGCILSPGYFLFDGLVEADCSSANLISVTMETRKRRAFQVSPAAQGKIVRAIREKSPAAVIASDASDAPPN